MKILIVCSGNHRNKVFDFKSCRPFVYEQAEALKKAGVDYDVFFVTGKGVLGYLRNYYRFIKFISVNNKYDLIHAHYGLSGLLATLQRKISVIVTYHGSDVHQKKTRLFSYLASRLSAWNIFVHPKMPAILRCSSRYSVISCGVDLDAFREIDKREARRLLGFNFDKIYILFSSSYDNKIKNYSLANKAISKLGKEVELVQLKGYSRSEVNLLLNAVDLLLVTSIRETGPLIVKEAMAVNCPVVSTDVGDVKDNFGSQENCFITSFDVDDVVSAIDKALKCVSNINSRKSIERFDNKLIAARLCEIYIKLFN